MGVRVPCPSHGWCRFNTVAPSLAQPSLYGMLGSELEPTLWEGHRGPLHCLHLPQDEEPLTSDPCLPSLPERDAVAV